MNKAITEIRGQDVAELQTKLGELRKEQFGLRFRGSADQVAKTTRHREVRRTIARILTVLGERAEPEKAAGSASSVATSTVPTSTVAATPTKAAGKSPAVKSATVKSPAGKSATGKSATGKSAPRKTEGNKS
ncbi:MAG: 50S ribosomal protein L29 [Planctomycetota bacterium]